ncbi:NAD(P)-binding protein [Myriangium duriaei CBS 260.36]|uniref:NAD(P)-binding protein n=1 Tax=Myriangium duriaei CBS 260.36 TaxID=1168546 RepID=A0A9P4J8L7_9PEZI|nr:NAD(P)-binding protein [Myriangium duriaei CBS 260.36]
MSIKHVAVFGGTGNLGPDVVNQLVRNGFRVTVLSRTSDRPSGLEEAAKVIRTDYSDADSVQNALKGIDAFVSLAGPASMSQQRQLIDQAISSGAKHIIPSEFGCDTTNEHAAKLAVFKDKVEVQAYLKELAAQDRVSYTLLMTGGFLDWGVRQSFLINPNGTTRLWDGGEREFSATLLADIGQAVASILKTPEAYKNRAVRINSAKVTQNKLLALARKTTGREFPTEQASTDEQFKHSLEVLKSGQGNIRAAILGLLMKAIYDPAYGSSFKEDESAKLGVKVLSESELEQVVGKAVAA